MTNEQRIRDAMHILANVRNVRFVLARMLRNVRNKPRGKALARDIREAAHVRFRCDLNR